MNPIRVISGILLFTAPCFAGEPFDGAQMLVEKLREKATTVLISKRLEKCLTRNPFQRFFTNDCSAFLDEVNKSLDEMTEISVELLNQSAGQITASMLAAYQITAKLKSDTLSDIEKTNSTQKCAEKIKTLFSVYLETTKKELVWDGSVPPGTPEN